MCWAANKASAAGLSQLHVSPSELKRQVLFTELNRKSLIVTKLMACLPTQPGYQERCWEVKEDSILTTSQTEYWLIYTNYGASTIHPICLKATKRVSCVNSMTQGQRGSQLKISNWILTPDIPYFHPWNNLFAYPLQGAAFNASFVGCWWWQLIRSMGCHCILNGLITLTLFYHSWEQNEKKGHSENDLLYNRPPHGLSLLHWQVRIVMLRPCLLLAMLLTYPWKGKGRLLNGGEIQKSPVWNLYSNCLTKQPSFSQPSSKLSARSSSDTECCHNSL